MSDSTDEMLRFPEDNNQTVFERSEDSGSWDTALEYSLIF